MSPQHTVTQHQTFDPAEFFINSCSISVPGSEPIQPTDQVQVSMEIINGNDMSAFGEIFILANGVEVGLANATTDPNTTRTETDNFVPANNGFTGGETLDIEVGMREKQGF